MNYIFYGIAAVFLLLIGMNLAGYDLFDTYLLGYETPIMVIFSIVFIALMFQITPLKGLIIKLYKKILNK